jgi:hypothetical protein
MLYDTHGKKGGGIGGIQVMVDRAMLLEGSDNRTDLLLAFRGPADFDSGGLRNLHDGN